MKDHKTIDLGDASEVKHAASYKNVPVSMIYLAHEITKSNVRTVIYEWIDNYTPDMHALNRMVMDCHGRSVAAGWYTDVKTGLPLERNVPEMLALIHSEVSEALEGYRKNLMDDKLPQYPMITVEIVDTIVRCFDLAGYLGLNVGRAYVDKLAYNASREDHKLENRGKVGGKAF